MLKIIDESGSGKTRKLIEFVSEHGGVIVCKDPTRLIEKACCYGYTNIAAISIYEYLNLENKADGHKYYIDDMENFLEEASIKFGKIDGFTLIK